MITKNSVVIIIVVAVLAIALAFIIKKPDVEIVPINTAAPITATVVTPETVVAPLDETVKTN